MSPRSDRSARQLAQDVVATPPAVPAIPGAPPPGSVATAPHRQQSRSACVHGELLAHCSFTNDPERHLTAVFDVNHSHWVDVEGATPERIAQQVAACPSGALTFERLNPPRA